MTVDLERLKGIVHQTVDIDVNATFEDFLARTGAADTDSFLAYLVEQQLIDGGTFVDLHGRGDIELDEASATPEGEVRPAQRYSLLGPVGVGAMGVVHVARDGDLRRKVAFKTMVKQGALYRRRFLDEVQITAQLDHPNVVPVYSVEVDAEGRPAYAMKLVRGRTLTQIVEAARQQADAGLRLDEDLRLAARLEAFLKVCEAVAYAHSKGVIHRDLKPDNVMVGRFGEVYTMDWGIAKLLGRPEGAGELAELGSVSGLEAASVDDEQETTRRTRMGSIVGTPAYMAPEQARGEVDAMGTHTDLFALGLVLHELIHLAPAYGGDDIIMVLAKASTARLDPPTAGVGEEIAPELVAIVARATQADPAARYESVEALAADVRRAMRGEETVALPDRPLRRARRWMVRHQQATFLLIALTVLGSLLAVAYSGYRRQVELAEERLASQARAARVVELIGQVGARAQAIDGDFLWYEGRLEGIGAAAVYALTWGTPTEGPWYHTASFREPSTAPADLAHSDIYGKPISPTYPVFTVAPGVDPDIGRRDLAIVDGLRDYLRSTFLVSPREPDAGAPLPEEQRARILGADRALRWAYVALEGSGLMYMYPGAPGWDEHYDPRTRPWYRDAVGHHRRVWSTPYVDLMGQGRLVSCVLPLYGADGDFLGVAGIDLQFNALLDEQLEMPDLPGYEAAYLLASDGRVMMQTTAKDDAIVIPPTELLDDGVDFGVFDHPRVVAGARSQRPGHVISGDRMLAWAPLHYLGWTYVVALDASAAGMR